MCCVGIFKKLLTFLLSSAIESEDTDGGNTQNDCVSGLCPSSGILNNRKHSSSETVSVSVLRRREGDTYSVGSLRKS
jgi:hypothetical protein